MRGTEAPHNAAEVDIPRDATYGQAVNTTAAAATNIGNAERSFLATGDPALIAQTDRQIDHARALFDTASGAATNAAERTAIGEDRTSFESWALAVRDDLAVYQAGHLQQALVDSEGPTLALRDGSTNRPSTRKRCAPHPSSRVPTRSSSNPHRPS